jgi:DNA-binding CsgD family transcriptional regulator
VSLAIDVEAATAPSIARTERIDAPLLRAPEGGHTAERRWLELLAELVAHPPRTLPCERIARLLCTTFRSAACSYTRIVDDSVVVGMVWSLDDGVTDLLRIGGSRRLGAAHDAVGTVALRAWNDLGPPVVCPDHMSLPLPLSTAGDMAFVLGRDSPYRSAELRLAAALWTLLTVLDVRIKGEVTPEHYGSPETTSLTPRELAVLGLLGDGLTAVAIGHRLRISSRTVHKHLERIYEKLDVNDRLTAVLAARRLGLIAC